MGIMKYIKRIVNIVLILKTGQIWVTLRIVKRQLKKLKNIFHKLMDVIIVVENVIQLDEKNFFKNIDKRKDFQTKYKMNLLKSKKC